MRRRRIRAGTPARRASRRPPCGTGQFGRRQRSGQHRFETGPHQRRKRTHAVSRALEHGIVVTDDSRRVGRSSLQRREQRERREQLAFVALPQKARMRRARGGERLVQPVEQDQGNRCVPIQMSGSGAAVEGVELRDGGACVLQRGLRPPSSSSIAVTLPIAYCAPIGCPPSRLISTWRRAQASASSKRPSPAYHQQRRTPAFAAAAPASRRIPAEPPRQWPFPLLRRAALHGGTQQRVVAPAVVAQRLIEIDGPQRRVEAFARLRRETKRGYREPVQRGIARGTPSCARCRSARQRSRPSARWSVAIQM